MSEPFQSKPPNRNNAPTVLSSRRRGSFTDSKIKNDGSIEWDFLNRVHRIWLRLWFILPRSALDAIAAALPDQPDAARFLNAAYDFAVQRLCRQEEFAPHESDTFSSELKQATILRAHAILDSLPKRFFVWYAIVNRLRSGVNDATLAALLCIIVWIFIFRMLSVTPGEHSDAHHPSAQTIFVLPTNTVESTDVEQPEAVMITEADRRFVTSLRRLLRETQSLFARTAGKSVPSLTESQRAHLQHLETEQLRLCRVFSEEIRTTSEEENLSEKNLSYQAVEPLLNRTVAAVKRNQLGNAIFLQSTVLRRLGFDPLADDFSFSRYSGANDLVSETALTNEDDLQHDEQRGATTQRSQKLADLPISTASSSGPAGGSAESGERAESNVALQNISQRWNAPQRAQTQTVPYPTEKILLEYKGATEKYFRLLE